MKNRRENLEGRKNFADMPERWQYDFTTALIPHPLLLLFYMLKSLLPLTQLSIFLLPSNTSVFAINVGVMEADHMLKLDKTLSPLDMMIQKAPVCLCWEDILHWLLTAVGCLLWTKVSSLDCTRFATCRPDEGNAFHISVHETIEVM